MFWSISIQLLQRPSAWSPILHVPQIYIIARTYSIPLGNLPDQVKSWDSLNCSHFSHQKYVSFHVRHHHPHTFPCHTNHIFPTSEQQAMWWKIPEFPIPPSCDNSWVQRIMHIRPVDPVLNQQLVGCLTLCAQRQALEVKCYHTPTGRNYKLLHKAYNSCTKNSTKRHSCTKPKCRHWLFALIGRISRSTAKHHLPESSTLRGMPMSPVISSFPQPQIDCMPNSLSIACHS